MNLKKIKNTSYGVQSNGTIWRLKGKVNFKGQRTPHIVNPTDNGNGYLYVRLNGKNYYVHRLVADYFIPNPDDLRYVGHKDHNKSNNDVSNLYWTTASDNTIDGVRDGKINYKGRCKNKMVLADDKIVEEVYVLIKSGEKLMDVVNKYNLNRTTVSSWVNKRSRTNITDKVDNNWAECH